MGQFTFQIDDQLKLLSSSTYADIERCALFAINNISRYVTWKGSVDFIVRIRPGTELTWSSADGLLPSLGQIGWNGKEWVNETLLEMQTGFDSDPKKPDAGCTIYLAKDGMIRNYGALVWFDPSPSFDVNPGIPKSTHDFIGIFTHEVFHCFGFYGATSQWKSLVEKRGKNYFFTGSKTTSLLGGPLMLADAYSENNFPDHYGNTSSIENNIARGLMFQWGNYERNRLDIGRVDLAILEDLGVKVLTYKGLPVTELSDVSPNVTGTPRSEAIYGDYHSNYLRSEEGNDTLDGAYGSDTIDGGDGIDTAIFEKVRSAYKTEKLSQDGITLWKVTDLATGDVDELRNIEKLEFAKASVAGYQNPVQTEVNLDVTGTPAVTYRLYRAAFARDPDLGGLGYWVSELQQYLNPNLSPEQNPYLLDVAKTFVESPEFKAKYGADVDNATYIRNLYKNALGRDPLIPDPVTGKTDAGYTYWVGVLDAKAASRSDLFVYFSESTENKAAVAPTIATGVEYVPWVPPGG